METWQIFSRMFGRKIKKLFASTLDRVPISVRCVASMIVVLNAIFALLRRTQTKNTVRTEEARPQCRVLLVETHRRLTFIAVFTVQAKMSLFMISNDL